MTASAANSRSLIESIAESHDVPHRWCSGAAGADAWRAYALDHAGRLANGSRLVSVGGDLDGADVLWRQLPWDSRVLGVSAARIDAIVARDLAEPSALRRAVAATLSEVRSAGVRHVVARVPTGSDGKIWALEREGFELVDGILTFGVSVADIAGDRATARTTDFTIREATTADADAVSSLAARIYTTDRFHNDPHIDSAAADAVYREWAYNSCHHTAADVVWVAESDAEILGFTTASTTASTRSLLRHPVLTIGLVGTAPAARRRGVALALTRHACARAKEMGMAAVEVGTQLRNIAASRTYELAGFRLVASSLTLRHWS